MQDWTVGSFVVLGLGLAATIGLWALLIWTMANSSDDR